MSRTKNEWEATSRMVNALTQAGITYEDAWQLRRISMTLQKWFEAECGNSNDHGSWCIVRGASRRVPTGVPGKYRAEFTHDDDGKPFIERISHQGPPQTHYAPIPDRERGARARLAKILAKYPGLQAYVQTDPRGCALYILREGDVPEGADVGACYSRGVAVHQ